MKILDFDLEGNHFIIEADVSPHQKADDEMECQWLQYDFENAQVYKETDGIVPPFQITAVAWAGYQVTADHALNDVIGRISRNETGTLTVHYVCPELQAFFDELKKYPAINGERTVPYFIFHSGDMARLAYATNEFLYYEDSTSSSRHGLTSAKTAARPATSIPFVPRHRSRPRRSSPPNRNRLCRTKK